MACRPCIRIPSTACCCHKPSARASLFLQRTRHWPGTRGPYARYSRQAGPCRHRQRGSPRSGGPAQGKLDLGAFPGRHTRGACGAASSRRASAPTAAASHGAEEAELGGQGKPWAGRGEVSSRESRRLLSLEISCRWSSTTAHEARSANDTITTPRMRTKRVYLGVLPSTTRKSGPKDMHAGISPRTKVARSSNGVLLPDCRQRVCL
jgi:hypothetical protein